MAAAVAAVRALTEVIKVSKGNAFKTVDNNIHCYNYYICYQLLFTRRVMNVSIESNAPLIGSLFFLSFLSVLRNYVPIYFIVDNYDNISQHPDGIRKGVENCSRPSKEL